MITQGSFLTLKVFIFLTEDHILFRVSENRYITYSCKLFESCESDVIFSFIDQLQITAIFSYTAHKFPTEHKKCQFTIA